MVRGSQACHAGFEYVQSILLNPPDNTAPCYRDVPRSKSLGKAAELLSWWGGAGQTLQDAFRVKNLYIYLTTLSVAHIIDLQCRVVT
jgi:hypothetical protein